MQIGNLKDKKREDLDFVANSSNQRNSEGEKKNRHSLCVMHFRRELSDITPNRQT